MIMRQEIEFSGYEHRLLVVIHHPVEIHLVALHI